MSEGLEFFGTLFVVTSIIGVLLKLLWKRYHNWTIVIGIALIYYWTLLGAWFIVFDQLTDNAGFKWGVHYYDYFDELFHIFLDKDYFFSILAYGLFIITIQLTLLKLPFGPVEKDVNQQPIWVYHPAFMIISLLALCASFLFIYPKLKEAIDAGQSLYLYTRLNTDRFFTLHQLCNEVAVVSLLIGIAILICKEDARYIAGKWSVRYLTQYIIVFVIVIFYLSILGNKHDLIFGGLAGIFLIYKNTNFTIKPGRYAAFILMIGVPLLATDQLRSLPWAQYLQHVTTGKNVVEPPPNPKKVGAIPNMVFHDEMFAAHMSMYGAMHFNMKLTYGSSLITLVESFVPRAIMPNRSEDIYTYYIDKINYTGTTGFTIHHATGWYLNFGWPGIIAGGFIFGFIWYYGMEKERKEIRGGKFKRLFFIMLPVLTPAFIPLFIRSGIEVYKAFLFEGLLIPVFILLISSEVFKYLEKNDRILK